MNKISAPIFILFCFFYLSEKLFSQPFIDPVNFNAQVFQSTYKDSAHNKNITADYNFNFLAPKVFQNGNTLFIRIGAENINSSIRFPNARGGTNLYALSLPLGFQFVSKNKKWKSLVMVIPKIASDMRDNLSQDVQIGGMGLITYVFNDSLKVKFGLFYNKECFGNFFVPLAGIDWRASKHWSIYGILPNNMRVEYKCCDKLYLGIGFKNYKRSYRLCNDHHNDFVLVKETQIKFFADYYMKCKIVLFADISYTLNYNLAEHSDTEPKGTAIIDPRYYPIYAPLENNFLFTAGIAYRLRTN